MHVLQLALQLDLLVAKPIQLSAQVADVGLKHALDVGASGGLTLQQVPLGLEHCVLLLQEADLESNRPQLVSVLLCIILKKTKQEGLMHQQELKDFGLFVLMKEPQGRCTKL